MFDVNVDVKRSENENMPKKQKQELFVPLIHDPGPLKRRCDTYTQTRKVSCI